MAISNHERIGKALELLNKGLLPFVEREMKGVHADGWLEAAKDSLPSSNPSAKSKQINWDTQAILAVMWNQWQMVFRNTLGRTERSLVSELQDIRNRWAHQNAFNTDDTYRVLDSAYRLLSSVSAPEATEIDRERLEVARIRYEEQTRWQRRKASTTAVAGQPEVNLSPWREIVTPHPDVTSGRYIQAEFAADLNQVYRGEGSSEYLNPTEFYSRTFLTDGLRDLLAQALRRLSDKGGEPAIELQTNFGGGKTHSMLALYHLFSGVALRELPGIDPILEAAEVQEVPKARRAVLVGTTGISPGQPHTKSDGTVVHTLWGEIAWQLGGTEGYALVQQADKSGTNPGEALTELFRRYAPCLILIDEWVAYARQLYKKHDLPSGSFETHFTFAQTLTEAAGAVPRTLVVATLPASDIEKGGEGGHEALARLQNVFERFASPWRPASADESFEIVRRRLFQPITDPKLFTARDLVIKKFAELYKSQSQEFPSPCREKEYERRMTAAYPIHPELFDRLYDDWSTIDRFQRTRGVLRLMAKVIHVLWERDDRSLLILPANVSIDDQEVKSELTRYLDDPWVPVIERDVDGPNSLPLRLDGENPNLGRYSACRRVARTIYLGSAPTAQTANRGIEDNQIKLGCAQPGESVATFGDALRRLTDNATHLYVDQRRYWFATQPSVTRLAQDRAAQQSEDSVQEEIRRRLRAAQSSRGHFAKVYPCPGTSGDVPDEQEARLVILDPEHQHSAKLPDSPALKVSQEFLDQRGTGPRLYKNSLVFLAADRARLEDLKEALRQYLAWKSIEDEKIALNLDPFQSNQARTKHQQADETVNQRIPETYQWLLVPGQSQPTSEVEWLEYRLQAQGPLAERAAKRLENEGLLYPRMGGVRLRLDLDNVPLWRGNHVGLKQLCEDFAQYLYLPRLTSSDTLLEAVQDGISLTSWEEETFGYAEDWDEEKGRYLGLRAGQGGSVFMDDRSVLVKPDIAAAQFRADAEKKKEYTTIEENGDREQDKDGEGTVTVEEEEQKVRRFHGSVAIDPNRLGRDAGQIAEAVVQHLTGLVNSRVEITLEIQGEIPDGVPDDVVRTVTENCNTLKFKNYGFEKE